MTPAISQLLNYKTIEPNESGFILLKLNNPDYYRHMASCLKRIVKYSRSRLPNKDAFQYNGLEEALLWLQLDQADTLHELDPRVRQAIGLIHTHLASPISLNELATQCHTSRSRLAAIFTKQVGLPIMQYWEQARMNRAMELLQISNLSIDQIAHELGYKTVSHFSHRFKSQNHVTPKEYRYQAKSNFSSQREDI